MGMPPEYTQETNEDGTAIRTVTYERSSTRLTTVLKYPEVFIDWPDAFTFDGELETTKGDSRSTQCVTIDEDEASTVAISDFPQATDREDANFILDGFEAGPSVTNDSTGLDHVQYVLTEEDAGVWLLGVFDQWFPNEPAVTKCYPPPGPHFGGFKRIFWNTTSTTSYISAVGTTTSDGDVEAITKAYTNTAEVDSSESAKTAAGTSTTQSTSTHSIMVSTEPRTSSSSDERPMKPTEDDSNIAPTHVSPSVSLELIESTLTLNEASVAGPTDQPSAIASNGNRPASAPEDTSSVAPANPTGSGESRAPRCDLDITRYLLLLVLLRTVM
ncbi:hypothetical protein HJFPF1_13467 [Paramyrothecium foliicola]|nr:hypothetical protein HJFPF1_13467 [Paramyrothecium foliicola]